METSNIDTKDPKLPRRRQANVYDAVAGRVSYSGFLSETPFTSFKRDTLSSTSQPLPPEKVLYRWRRASVRRRASNAYWRSRDLASEDAENNSKPADRLSRFDIDRQGLPDSDLLKVVHVYASNFYARTASSNTAAAAITGTHQEGAVDVASMDETALLAIGMLLEEAAKAALGETGDLVFVEPDSADEHQAQDNAENDLDGKEPWQRADPVNSSEQSHGQRASQSASEGVYGSSQQTTSLPIQAGKNRKRRKVY
ncbi:hypothetical protein MMC25_002520 [Agyrium rufum]|nr:hypothetical protein [Agyrium rufum]